jgi:hypothetical protein
MLDAKLNNDKQYRNILCSYAYLRSKSSFNDILFDYADSGKINLMIDSGAFTVFNSNVKPIYVEDYVDWLKLYGKYSQKYVMLDVINNPKESAINYKKMVESGLSPMFVMTMADEDYSILEFPLKVNKHLCVAGGVTSKGKWIIKRFQDIAKLYPEALIHGLGYVTFPSMLQLPLYSVDSSSWIVGSQKFGQLYWWDNGLNQLRYHDILTRKKKIPESLRLEMQRSKITPKMFSDLENHRTDYSIGSYLGIKCYITYQKYCKDRGLDLFLALSGKGQFEKYIGVNYLIAINECTYPNYIQYLKNIKGKK